MTDPANYPYLTAVGLGPGDPELITLKGLTAIKAAHFVFVPLSKDGDKSLALRIAEPWLSPEQQVIQLPLPMTRNADELVPAWEAAADVIADCLDQGPEYNGVYLLLGDPLLYGTFTYIWGELQARHAHIQVSIIPGITSFADAAVRAKVVLSTTNDRVAILPASYETDTDNLRRLITDFDTIILLKVGPVFPQIRAALDELCLLENAIYAERVGMPEEYIVQGLDINTLSNERQPYLSLMIVRKAVL